MYFTRLTILSALAIALPMGASAQNKCDGADIANGPFKYALVNGQPTTATFVGTVGAPVTTAFTVIAPGPGTVFPAESRGGQCSATAAADIKVLAIKKVVSGSNVDVPLGSVLGSQIASAFTLTPSSHAFGIGESATVGVLVANPNVTGGDYGTYIVTMKAQAIGSGVGVGSGFEFALNLHAPSLCVKNAAPVISILKPTASPKIIGNIKVQVQAFDPAGPCASGLKSLTATVSSAGGAVNSLAIPLTLNNALPLPAGAMVTGDGVFIPKGGSGNAGNSAGLPFTAMNLSGLGTYTITFVAEDMAGGTSQEKVTFEVNYAVLFTMVSTPGGCVPDHLGASCKGQYQMTVKRANGANPDDFSDGVFMFDQTVSADLVNTSDGAAVATHSYGTGAIGSYLQIDTNVYKTVFGHPTGLPYTELRLKVYFTDIDGNRLLQATSDPLSF